MSFDIKLSFFCSVAQAIHQFFPGNTHTHARAYTHTHTHARRHTHAHTHTDTHTHARMHTHTHTRAHTCTDTASEKTYPACHLFSAFLHIIHTEQITALASSRHMKAQSYNTYCQVISIAPKTIRSVKNQGLWKQCKIFPLAKCGGRERGDYYQWYFKRRDSCGTTELPLSCVSQIFWKHEATCKW